MGKWLYAFVVTLFSLAVNLMLRMTSKRLPGLKCKCGHCHSHAEYPERRHHARPGVLRLPSASQL